MSRSKFTPSGQAEIIRAVQKDDLITNNLQEYISDILFNTAGNRIWLQWRAAIEASSKVLYYGLTTLSNFQTIGEEYTGIIQVDSTLKKIPTKSLRALSIILDACGYHLILHLIDRLEQDLKRPSLTRNVRPEARRKLLETIVIVRQILPFVQRFHKAVFFLTSVHYHLSKRTTGIRYILARHWLSNRRSDSGFRLLGIVSIIYLLAHSGYSTLNWWRTAQHEATLLANDLSTCADSARCSLCMEERKSACATSCGHLFCWTCILQWLQSNQQCPMCRETIQANRVVLLQNL